MDNKTYKQLQQRRQENKKDDVSKDFQNARKIVIGNADAQRRANLLKNAEYGLGKVERRGNHLVYTVGSEEYGFIQYLILGAANSLPGINVPHEQR